MPLVIDVSAIVGQLLDEQEAAFAEQVLSTVAEEGGVVPPVFWYEVRNVLVMCERKAKLTADQSRLFLESLDDLALEIDPLPENEQVTDAARRHALTIYDAAYLELAMRRGLVLATTDRALARAARAHGVKVMAPPSLREIE